MKVVIDADQMIYSCGFAAEGEPLSHSLKLVKNKIEEILSVTGADEYEIYLEGKGNWREDMAWDYKANRTSRKPTHFADIRTYLMENWDAKEVFNMETDDMVSMKLWEDFRDNEGKGVILSSVDKDLKNTPGWHYNPMKQEKFWVNEDQARRHYWWQVLAGDRTDNIPGLPFCGKATRDKFGLTRAAAKGCGAASAKAILSQSEKHEEEPNVYEAYVHWAIEADVDRDRCFDYLCEQMALLWMVRELDEYGDPVLPQANGAMFDDIWETVEKDLAKGKGAEGEGKSENSDTPEQEARDEEAGVE